MGYTHHSRISSTNGYSVGAKGSEQVIVDGSGSITTSGNLPVGGVQQNTAQGAIVLLLAGVSTAAQTEWGIMPYACNVSGYVVLSVSSGTGRAVTVEHGSAGDVALTTGAQGVSGTIGAVLTFTSGTVAFTAGEAYRVAMTSCATAQPVGVTIILTKV
jgi:hypothetical protein